MQLFSKEKGLIWGIANGLLLATGVIIAFSTIGILIFGGITESTWSGILGCAGAIGLDILTIMVINKKINLLDPSYPLSRKLFNLIMVMDIFSSFALLWIFLVGIMTGGIFSSSSLLSILAPLVTHLVVVTAANSKPIMIKSNSRVLNAVNFIGLLACSGVISVTLTMLFNSSVMRSSYAGKTIIFLLLVLAGMIALLVVLNSKKDLKKNGSDTLPKKFNTEKGDTLPKAFGEEKAEPVKTEPKEEPAKEPEARSESEGAREQNNS